MPPDSYREAWVAGKVGRNGSPDLEVVALSPPEKMPYAHTKIIVDFLPEPKYASSVNPSRVSTTEFRRYVEETKETILTL